LSKVSQKLSKICQKLSKNNQKVVKKMSKSCQKNVKKVVKKVQKAQLEKLPHSYQLLSIVINSDFWLRFLLHKKALKSFLHSLTICDKVASGNKKKKKIIGIP
jgi:archaellum component FlaD/FlaE